MQFLKANTEVKVRIGPFVDVGDGFTPETGVTLSGADEAELLKNNGASTTDISGATWTAVTGCDGWYDLTLTSSHTNTEGLLTVVVQDDNVCLPVFAHFMVLAQAAFDSLFTAKDTGYLDVNVKAISDDTAAADNLELLTENALGADNKMLVSTDAQDLSGSFDVNTKLIEGSDATNQIASAVAGPGDYTVTLTIRTTAGAALSGVSVWVNTSNDRTGSVVQTKITNDSGQVTFSLNYTTYYIFCHLSGYTFAAASFTAAAGSVSFTKDIATAVSSGSSSFYSDSFLSRAIVDVREAVDEPTASAKYTDARIIELLEKSYILVLNEKNRNNKTPAVVKQELTIASNITEYALPHSMGSLYGVYDRDSAGGKIYYDGRSRYNPFGQRLWLEGHTLHIQSTDAIGVGTQLIAEWLPMGVARLHNGVCTLNSDGDEVTFGSTPNAGALDTHPHAYAGAVIRILGADGTTVTGNYLQERNITAYDHETRVATLDVALDPIPTTDDGYIYYEIAPAIHKGMESAVALYTAYRIMTTEGNKKRADGLLSAYRNELRNVRLTAYYSNMSEAPRLPQDGHNNRRYRRL